MAPDERLARLDDWRGRLHQCQSTPDGPVFTALAETIRRHAVPIGLLDDLLTAFRQDVTVERHATHEDLLAYCRISAVPVGRLVLHLFGYRDRARQACSDAVCSALQLTNFWQDMGVDFSRGRIYLPQVDMHRFGVTEDDLQAARVTDGFRDLVAFQVERTRRLFDAGRDLPEMVTGRLRYELRLTILGGLEILRKIEAAGFDVLNHRPALRRIDMARLLARSVYRLTASPENRP
jgi:squalene synthase HpnC